MEISKFENRITPFLFVLIFGAVLVSCHKDPPSRPALRSPRPVIDTTPRIDSIAPKSGPVGTEVTVYGKYLGDSSSRFSINRIPAKNKTSSETKFVIIVPDSAGTGPVTLVKKSQQQASGPVFNYVLTDTWTVSTFAGSGVAGSVDLAGTLATFRDPRGIARDASGNLYVSDAGNHKIRKISSAGMVSTFAGGGATGVAPGSTDGTGTSALFNNPLGIAIDRQNNLYVADAGNHKIRKITPAGVVSTVAGGLTVGGATAGYADNMGVAALFRSPVGIAITEQNNLITLYVGDAGNHRIRRINSTNTVSTVAGSGTAGSGTGTGTSAQFNGPCGITIDLQGNLFVADYNGQRIRKVTLPAAVVTNPIGSGNATFADGNGASASFNGPYGITIDPLGNLYVADWNNNRIRKILMPQLDVKTFAGRALSTPFADGDAVTQATLNHPGFMVIDAQGNFYVTDASNNRVRKITLRRH